MKTVVALLNDSRLLFDEARAHDRPVVVGRPDPGSRRSGFRRPVNARRKAGASIDRLAGLSHSQGPPGAWSGPVVLGKDRVACRPRQKRSRRPLSGAPSVDRSHGQLAGTGAADCARRPSAVPRGLARLGRRQARRRGGCRRDGLRALVRGAACRSATTFATARLQPHRHGAAHQPRPRAARGGGDRGGGRGHALAHDARIRPRGRRARRARRPCRALAVRG